LIRSSLESCSSCRIFLLDLRKFNLKKSQINFVSFIELYLAVLNQFLHVFWTPKVTPTVESKDRTRPNDSYMSLM
jgi:hypothetical protein